LQFITTVFPRTLPFFANTKLFNMKNPDLMIKLGERIKELRVKKNMTQNDLAIECEFEKASMSRLEAGRTNPTIRTLHKISTALDVQIVELFRD